MKRIFSFLTIFSLFYSFGYSQTAIDTSGIEIGATDAASGDQFGFSVASDGKYTIVGARKDDEYTTKTDVGSAYIFEESNNEWFQKAKITASDGMAFDQFGNNVAISGKIAIVGARDSDNTGTVAGNSEGSAYVYRLISEAWTFVQKLTMSELVANDRFGTGLAFSDNDIIISADGRDDIAGGAGALYVFNRVGLNLWTFQQKLIPSDAGINDQHGLTISTSGDYMISGSTGDDSFAGSAYIYIKDNLGVWTQQAKIVPSDPVANNRFGLSVAINSNEDLVAVGAYLGDGNVTDSGAVYLFRRSGTVWIQEAKLKASDGLLNDRFGYTVNIAKKTVVVSSYLDDNSSGNPDGGSVYIYKNIHNVWTETSKMQALDGLTLDSFGLSVCINKKNIMIGAYLHDHSAISDSGGVYIFGF